MKGIPYLLNALAVLKKKREDFHLDVVGYGPYREEYERMVINLGLSDKVKFHGMKTKREVAKFIKECEFLVLPSLYESFGIVLLEAMACGKPVITTLSGGQKEFVNENTGILVPAKDVNALASAIDYMLDNYHKYSPQRISKYVREAFSYKTIGKLLYNAYIELLTNKES